MRVLKISWPEAGMTQREWCRWLHANHYITGQERRDRMAYLTRNNVA